MQTAFEILKPLIYLQYALHLDSSIFSSSFWRNYFRSTTTTTTSIFQNHHFAFTTTSCFNGIYSFSNTIQSPNIQSFELSHSSSLYGNYYYSTMSKLLDFGDYYPFGSLQPDRNWNSATYRFGAAGGQEKDDEISGPSNSYTAEYWQYDSRLCHRWSVDPMSDMYPSMSPYMYVAGNPVRFYDPDGRKIFDSVNEVAVSYDQNGNVSYSLVGGGAVSDEFMQNGARMINAMAKTETGREAINSLVEMPTEVRMTILSDPQKQGVAQTDYDENNKYTGLKITYHPANNDICISIDYYNRRNIRHVIKPLRYGINYKAPH